MFAEGSNHYGLEVSRRYVLRANLEDARSLGAGGREDRTKVKVVREYDVQPCFRPRHDLCVGRTWTTYARPVHCLPTMALENSDPLRGQIHVDDQSHDTRSGTSTSSTRQAA